MLAKAAFRASLQDSCAELQAAAAAVLRDYGSPQPSAAASHQQVLQQQCTELQSQAAEAFAQDVHAVSMQQMVKGWVRLTVAPPAGLLQHTFELRGGFEQRAKLLLMEAVDSSLAAEPVVGEPLLAASLKRLARALPGIAAQCVGFRIQLTQAGMGAASPGPLAAQPAAPVYAPVAASFAPAGAMRPAASSGRSPLSLASSQPECFAWDGQVCHHDRLLAGLPGGPGRCRYSQYHVPGVSTLRQDKLQAMQRRSEALRQRVQQQQQPQMPEPTSGSVFGGR